MFRSFIDRKLYRIRGFLHPVDAMVFSAILEYQAHRNIRGGMAEIGVFFGRSLTLMAKYLRRGEEKALGMDLYNIGEQPGTESAQLAYVRNVLRTENVEGDAILLQQNSHTLRTDDITQRVGTVRFFSIDGGHELPDVLHDSQLARGALSADGVIAFDDFFNPQYPDVTVAVLAFLKQHADEFTAFAITKNKLYVARAGAYSAYFEAMQSATMWAGAYHECFQFLGNPIVHWSQSLPNRILYQKCAERGLGAMGEALTRPTKNRATR